MAPTQRQDAAAESLLQNIAVMTTWPAGTQMPCEQTMEMLKEAVLILTDKSDE